MLRYSWRVEGRGLHHSHDHTATSRPSLSSRDQTTLRKARLRTRLAKTSTTSPKPKMLTWSSPRLAPSTRRAETVKTKIYFRRAFFLTIPRHHELPPPVPPSHGGLALSPFALSELPLPLLLPLPSPFLQTTLPRNFLPPHLPALFLVAAAAASVFAARRSSSYCEKETRRKGRVLNSQL